ncbi:MULTISPECIES: hypothetical protein [Streptomyces]|uniref:Uncharacterized protein n=1 Tax=Streptomyces dengpaensis TaxID=2049881 RepID=A0ABN5HY34_9ACTN|nr:MULTISPECIES: hypothetical protein [Streptomyces]AVH55648.1 hypothetical protein C4B68_07475 [Streptomyces dengpaensis]PIB11909.1 hypothetical protein B1C81_01435 [Streptomyces sp. HG99]
MPEHDDDAGIPVTSEEISSFASRLSDWSESLAPAERSLAQVLLQYTRDLRPEDVRRQQLASDLDAATRDVIASVKERWSLATEASAAWVEVGPIWQKANPREGREEWEIVQWTYTRPEKWTPPYA